MRPQSEAYARGTDTFEREGVPPEPPTRWKSAPLAAPRSQNSDAPVSPSQFAEWLAPRGGPTTASPIEGASVPTAATATARTYADRLTVALPNHSSTPPPQEPSRYRRGSVRAPSATSSESQHTRRPQSEGPQRRATSCSSYTYYRVAGCGVAKEGRLREKEETGELRARGNACEAAHP